MTNYKNRLGLTSHEVCKSKVKYGNLKSVERGIRVLSKAHGHKLTYYRCGTSKHYHLTHVDPTKRTGAGGSFHRQNESSKINEESENEQTNDQL